MILPVSSYNTNFNGKTKLAQKPVQKIVRKVVKSEMSNLKGIAKTPVRLASQDNNLGDDFWHATSYVLVTATATSLWC